MTKPDVFKLVLTDEQKAQLKFIKSCREERAQQFQDDYDREVADRAEDAMENDDDAPTLWDRNQPWHG